MPDEHAVPAIAQYYMSFVQSFMDNPVMKRSFFQVAWLSLQSPEHGSLELFALEFHLPHHLMFAWKNDRGSWEIGDQIPMNQTSASKITLGYFRNGIELQDFEDVLDEIESRQHPRRT
jgi:hypothetical protein